MGEEGRVEMERRGKFLLPDGTVEEGIGEGVLGFIGACIGMLEKEVGEEEEEEKVEMMKGPTEE